MAMNNWFQQENGYYDIPKGCGTAACIGGWGLSIHSEMSPKDYVKVHGDSGISYLQLTKLFEINLEQSQRLFNLDCWPSEFRDAYKHYTDKELWEARAEVVSERIQVFIDSKGKE